MERKKATPFAERSLLRQERDITDQCDSRLNKLTADGHLKVARELLRGAEERAKRAISEAEKQGVTQPIPAGGLGDL